MADKTVRNFIENYLKFYTRMYDLSFLVILFKQKVLNTYSSGGSPVVEHSTADPEVEGSNPATALAERKSLKCC